MNKYWWMIGAVYFAGLPLQAQEQTNIIEINGQAYVDVQPDLVIVMASISHLSSSLATSKEQVDEVYQKSVNAMQNLNIEAKDIKGESLRAYPELVWEKQRQVNKGERVTRQLVITVRNLESYAEVVAALLSAGVSNIDNTTAGFSNPNEGRQLALGLAADNAVANAGFLAARLGRELVTVKRIVDRSVANQLPVCARAQMMRAESMDAAAVPEENFGTERINASVFVEFELE
jgi:uncharacterized protein YggE